MERCCAAITCALLAACVHTSEQVARVAKETSGSAPRAIEIAAGARHACALLDDANVVCWGDNRKGQLAQRAIKESGAPVGVAGFAGSLLAAAEDATCAVTREGAVVCWGEGAVVPGGASREPARVEGVPAFVSIAIGHDGGCGVDRDGHVACWGSGELASAMKSVHVEGVTQLVAGTGHFCARVRSASVTCWGRNAHGELGLGSTSPSEGPTEALVDDVTAIVAHAGFTCAWGADDDVFCWGGVEGGPPPIDRPVGLWLLSKIAGVAIPEGVVDGAATRAEVCLLTHEGNVACGTRERPTPEWLALSGVDRVVATEAEMCGLFSDGDVRCWGKVDASGKPSRAAPVSVLRASD